MSGKHRGGDSGIGTGTHPEKVLPPGGRGAKRSKHKCIYYESATRDCVCMHVGCVGPSNPLCKHYCETIRKPNVLKENALVVDSQFGVGIVTKIYDKDFYVKFENVEGLRCYFIKDIKQIKQKIIYV